MLTDLRYALAQLRPVAEAIAKQVSSVGDMPAIEVEDRVSLAMDALERCIEAAQVDEIARGLTDADLEAMFAEAPADPMPTQFIPLERTV